MSSPRSAASPTSSTDGARLRTLYAYGILDTEGEERFDRLARLAAQFVQAPVAMVTFLDRERLWVKACIGMDLTETSRAESFCTYTIERDEVMVVEDATQDARFASRSDVAGPPHVRFYAGAPLTMPDGQRIGTLCVYDFEPRPLAAPESEALRDLAALVVDELELRREVSERQAREHQYRALFESASDALLLLRPEDEIILEANEQAAALYGKSREDLIGSSLEAYSQNPARGKIMIDQLFDKGSITFETWQTREDGTPIAVEVYASLVEHEGSPAILASSRDVTARNSVETAFRLNEERLRLALDAGKMGTWAWNLVSDALTTDEQQRALLGVTADALPTAEAFLSYVHPQDLPGVRSNIDEAVEKRRDYEADFRIVRPDGEVRWIAARGRVMYRDGSVWPEMLGVHFDVTDRKQIEDALRVSERRYRHVVESVRDIVLQTDVEGRWTFLNPAWETITGFTVEEALGRSLFAFIHPEERHRIDEHFASLLREDVPFVRFETRCLTKSGDCRHVDVHAHLTRNDAGEVTGTSGTVSDITNTVRFEAEREAHERTEAMLRLKSVFLDNMSHEIRTPLTGILGFSEVLVEEVSEDLREFATVIHSSAFRLLDTLNSVLDLAQIESGNLEMNPQWIDVMEEVNNIVLVMRPLAERKGLTLAIEAPSTSAFLDREAVNRIIHNLLGNAVKFTDRGSVTVTVEQDGDEITLCVADTGIGINSAFLPCLFDEFKQASEGYNRSHEGNGLGLAITHRLVTLMGGTIEVESAVGTGTRFTLRLPCRPVTSATPAVTASVASTVWHTEAAA